jgi:hypothetical protein
MNSVDIGLDAEQYFVLQQYVEAWQQPGAERPSVYDMPDDVAEVLAAANIFTTSIGVANADKQLPTKEYLKQKGYEFDLGTIADNTIEALRDVPEFKEAARPNEFGHNELGSALAKTFSAITGITAHNIHATKPKIRRGKVVDGTVVAERMVFDVAAPDQSQKLLAALQQLLITSDGKACGVVPAFNSEGQVSGVEVRGLNEHMARSLSRAIEALIVREDQRKFGTVLPTVHLERVVVDGKKEYHIVRQKLSLVEWEKRGETFHPVVRKRLDEADAAYKALSLQASYDDDPEMQQITTNKLPDYHLLGTDGAGALQGMRDLFNVQIARVRGGTYRNPEQDPNKKARLRIDRGTDLKRAKATAIDTAKGPLTAHRTSLVDQAKSQGGEVAAQVRAKPARGGLELIELISDVSASKLVLTGLKNTVLAKRGAKRMGEIELWLDERRRFQDPDYLLRRLSWLAHIGSQYNLNEAGKQRLKELQDASRS